MNTDENDDSDENSAHFSVLKPMRKGRQYFLSRHVTNIKYMSQPTHYYIYNILAILAYKKCYIIINTKAVLI